MLLLGGNSGNTSIAYRYHNME